MVSPSLVRGSPGKRGGISLRLREVARIRALTRIVKSYENMALLPGHRFQIRTPWSVRVAGVVRMRTLWLLDATVQGPNTLGVAKAVTTGNAISLTHD